MRHRISSASPPLPQGDRAPDADFRVEYAAALGEYLENHSELALCRAAALGRRALASSFGILDFVAMHNAGLEAALARRARDALPGDLEANGAFLAEALSAFEMVLRGSREAGTAVSRILHFAAVVCHELRTPLTSVVNSIGMLAEALNLSPKTDVGRLLANIARGADLLRARTNDLVDLVALRSGALTLKLQPTDAGRLIDLAVQGVAQESAAAHVVIQIERPAELPSIVADPDRLHQILVNLLQNALRYGADGGRIDLRARPEAGSLVIEVQDYGRGISLWDRMRIFEPSYRGSNHSGDIPGLGIGVALCSALVQEHAGSITLQSDEGKGSRFRVTIPLRLPPADRGAGYSFDVRS